MKLDTAIAKEMILDANKDCIFTAEGRLIAKLPPKRRCKTSAHYVRPSNSDSFGQKPARTFYPLKRSGHPHQQWKTKPSVLVTKLGFDETISDGIERFVSHLHLAQAR
jgi:hypothetical protein